MLVSVYFEDIRINVSIMSESPNKIVKKSSTKLNYRPVRRKLYYSDHPGEGYVGAREMYLMMYVQNGGF